MGGSAWAPARDGCLPSHSRGQFVAPWATFKKSSSEFSVPLAPPHSLLGGPWRLPGLSGSEPRFKIVFSCSRPTPEQFDDAKGSHVVGSSTSMAGRPEFMSSHRDSAQLCRPTPVGFQHARSRSRARRRGRQHELLGAGLPHAHRLCSRVSRALGAMQELPQLAPHSWEGSRERGREWLFRPSPSSADAGTWAWSASISGPS